MAFTDEKQCNLDGAGGILYYRHDPRKEPEKYLKQIQGGRSVLVWGATPFNGKLDLVEIEEKKDSE